MNNQQNHISHHDDQHDEHHVELQYFSNRSNPHQVMQVHQLVLHDNTANPGPLGLLGFGLTTFLLNVHNAGGYGMNTMIIAMGFLFGGFAQLLAGLLEWKKNNLFGFIAFCSYGCFWITFCIMLTLPTTRVPPPDTNALGCYMMIWGVFSFGMWIATLKKAPWLLSFLFLTVWLLFLLLAIFFFSQNEKALKAAGVEGSICGILAIYIAFAEILNETYGTTVLPICERQSKENTVSLTEKYNPVIQKSP